MVVVGGTVVVVLVVVVVVAGATVVLGAGALVGAGDSARATPQPDNANTNRVLVKVRMESSCYGRRGRGRRVCVCVRTDRLLDRDSVSRHETVMCCLPGASGQVIRHWQAVDHFPRCAVQIPNFIQGFVDCFVPEHIFIGASCPIDAPQLRVLF